MKSLISFIIFALATSASAKETLYSIDCVGTTTMKKHTYYLSVEYPMDTDKMKCPLPCKIDKKQSKVFITLDVTNEDEELIHSSSTSLPHLSFRFTKKGNSYTFYSKRNEYVKIKPSEEADDEFSFYFNQVKGSFKNGQCQHFGPYSHI